jgi:hypothetical protein
MVYRNAGGFVAAATLLADHFVPLVRYKYGIEHLRKDPDLLTAAEHDSQLSAVHQVHCRECSAVELAGTTRNLRRMVAKVRNNVALGESRA